MGYYEQIGIENRRHRERLAAMPRHRRILRHWATAIFCIGVSALLWALLLSPLWAPVVNAFRG